MKQHVTLLKLGGAVITNKDIPESIRHEVLERLVKEIARAKKEKDIVLILGNGAGSFAHVPATRYKTSQGFIHAESVMGMAITQDSAARLNREVVKVCLTHGLPAVTLSPANSLVTKSKVADSYFTQVFEEYLKKGLVPVTYGDVIVDRDQGCTIWSTDRVFTFFAQEFETHGIEVDQIIHVTEAAGVWIDGKLPDPNTPANIYQRITPAMRDEVKRSMTDIKGFDVTGGMWHKIEEALSLTERGITTRIISGLVPGYVYKTLLGDTSNGTTISRV